MRVMTDREERRQLKGFVQVDDAYLGGERNGGKPGRGSENKQAFLIAVETNEDLTHPTFAVIEPLRTFDNDSVADWASRRLEPGTEVYSDGLPAFGRFAAGGHAHTVLQSTGGRAATEVHGAKWVNVLLSNVKRSLGGAYHSVKQRKYCRLYLGEAAWRFNRRFDLPALLPRLLRVCAIHNPAPERLLRQSTNYLS